MGGTLPLPATLPLVERRAVVEVIVKPAQGQGGVRERLLEQSLAGCCECCVLSALHPHTALSIVLQIHTAQGSVSEETFSLQPLTAVPHFLIVIIHSVCGIVSSSDRCWLPPLFSLLLSHHCLPLRWKPSYSPHTSSGRGQLSTFGVCASNSYPFFSLASVW